MKNLGSNDSLNFYEWVKFVDDLVVGVLVYWVYEDQDKTVIELMNKEAENILGYNVDNMNLLEGSVWDLVAEENREYVKTMLSDGIFINDRLSLEFPIVDSRRKEKWIGGYAKVFARGKDEKGSYSKVQLCFADITERKVKNLKIVRKAEEDGLTHLENRVAYENLLQLFDEEKIAMNNVTVIAADLNGLKAANDDLGHEYGDELIKGAAEVLSKSIGKKGHTFRVGGDEFVGIIIDSVITEEKLEHEILLNMGKWKGTLNKKISLAFGIATSREYPDFGIHDLLKISDKRMMHMKENFYMKNGVDRRLRQASSDTLFDYYIKILRVNLITDKFEIVQMDWDEQSVEKGFHTHFSNWVKDFAAKGQVHPDDVKEFLEKMELEYIRGCFSVGRRKLSFCYRRMCGNEYKLVNTEIIIAKEFSSENQLAYVYVREEDIV